MVPLLRELWLFLREERKWWLVPLLAAFGLVGVLVTVGALFPNAAPFLYSLL
jgi:hypothetical protein